MFRIQEGFFRNDKCLGCAAVRTRPSSASEHTNSAVRRCGRQFFWSPTAEDCADLCGVETDLALVFNSIGAGASQNHVHAHAWPAPPVGAARYAVEGAAAARSTSVGGVEVELLDYPLCAVRLRGEGRGEALGRAMAELLVR